VTFGSLPKGWGVADGGEHGIVQDRWSYPMGYTHGVYGGLRLYAIGFAIVICLTYNVRKI
jgi:hypothetical protein